MSGPQLSVHANLLAWTYQADHTIAACVPEPQVEW